MALMVPVKFAHLTVPLPAHVSPHRRRFNVSATLSSPPRGDTTVVDWVKETASYFEQDSRPIMLFDGVCNLCNGGVKFVRDNDRRRNIRFEALQSEAGKKLLQRSGRAPDDISSVVLVEKDRHNCGGENDKFQILFGPHLHLRFNEDKGKKLKVLYQVRSCTEDYGIHRLALSPSGILPANCTIIRDFVYENIADNRYNFFGRSDSCDI
ncbi:hypothetical protein DH2020_016483 [Rehmannia glutinosa]|uniref:DCC family protein n=1 Tax=Rehmannia glutinosa TaxID=99300 RepID=A0ABR0WN39_REHGL